MDNSAKWYYYTMMGPIIGFIGLLTALFPDRILNVYEDVAIENPDECLKNQWISSGIRTEGFLVTAASLFSGRLYTWMMNLTGAFGGLVLVSPQFYRNLAINLLYQNPAEVEWNDQFDRIVRILGITYVLLALWEYKKRRGSD